jgi:peptidoglycan hydrolase-like protein with peptidoglycan-binding domain
MKLKVRARSRPPIWALAIVFAFAMAPAAAAESPPGGSDAGAQGTDRPAGWSAAQVALGTGFHSPGASERVREVQRRLNRLGYGTGAVDGLFGPITDAAVRRFQSDSRLAVDGVVGRRTLGQLRSRSRQQERLLARGSGFADAGASERVRNLQKRLNRLGHGAGAVDGLFGARTDAAVRRFQGATSLAVDGIVGPRTLRALGLARERSRAATRSEPAPSRETARRVARRTRPAEPAPPEAPRGAPEALEPVSVPGPASEPEEPAGFRWFVLLPVVAILVLIIAVGLALTTDPSSAWEHDPAWTEPDGEGLPPEAAIGDTVAPVPEPSRQAWRAQLVDVPHAKRLLGVGARAALATAPHLGAAHGTIYVELQLFAEGERRRWETEPLDGGAPFSVAAEELEEDIWAIVVPDRLPILARTLRNAGTDVQASGLAVLPFMLELSPELEAELARRRLAPTLGFTSLERRSLRSSEGGLQ